MRGRPKKKKIDLSAESLVSLMQEIYNDCSEQRKRALSDINERKAMAEMDNTTDIYQVGKVNNESLKLIDSVIEKKLSLVKLQSQLLDKSGNEVSGGLLSENDKELLREIVKEQEQKNNIKYDI
jgi:hypothetical protein